MILGIAGNFLWLLPYRSIKTEVILLISDGLNPEVEAL